MNVKRTATLGVVGGAVIVWFAAASTSTPPRTPASAAPKTGAVEVSGAQLALEIARLHERLRPTEAPTETRDLFRYASRPSARWAAPSGARPAPALVAAASDAAPAPMPFKLVGMAEDPSDAGPVRSAILSGHGDLFIVKQGDAVTSRYRVATIFAEGVDLTDLSDHTTLHLALK